MTDTEYARIAASPPRRVIGVGMQAVLGALLLCIAFAFPPEDPGWLVFLLVVSGGMLTFARWTWRATAGQIRVTEAGLFDETGAPIARMEDIVEVERGLFVFKPANGFALRLKAAAPRAWRPGLWWRLGRRVAIGGMTARHETAPVADLLAIRLAQRGR